MGLTVSAKVVCGFELERVPVFENHNKFNEDTGKPYTKRVKTDDVIARVAGVDIVTKHSDYLLDGEMIEGLEINTTANGQYCIGEVATECAGWNREYFKVFDHGIPATVLKFADKYSLPAPQWLLVLYVG